MIVTQAIHLREMNLQYTKISTTEDNNNVLEDVAVKLPLLSIMSLNSLKVDTAKVVLDAEIELYSKTVKNQCLRARPINTSSTSPQVHIEINLKEGEPSAKIVESNNVEAGFIKQLSEFLCERIWNC